MMGILRVRSGIQGDEAMISKYVKGQGGQYKKLHSDYQLGMEIK